MVKLLMLLLPFLFVNDSVPTINFNEFEKRVINPENDTLYVVNFWATWCKPCVAELPFFENQFTKIQDKPVRILMASLDFKNQIDRLEKFRNDRNMNNEVFLLDTGNSDDWITKVYPFWGGAIPATAFYKSGKMRYFHDAEFTGPELDSTITAQLNKK